MRYNLRNGYTVETTEMGDKTAFETKNPEGEVISTVCLPREEARELVIGLRTAVALRSA